MAAAPPVEPWELDGSFQLPQGVDPAVLTEARVAATGILWALSGRRYGTRISKVRPILGSCSVAPWWQTRVYSSLDPWSNGYGFMPVSCGACGGGGACHCDPSIFKLSSKAHEVSGVKVDGTTLDPSEWELVESRWLRRIDGAWPRCQNPDLPDTEAGTMSFVLRWGPLPPATSKTAMAKLTAELVKAKVNDKTCELPSRVQSVARQGISFALLDPMTFLDEGKTGMYLVDQFLVVANPSGSKRPPGIWRADA